MLVFPIIFSDSFATPGTLTTNPPNGGNGVQFETLDIVVVGDTGTVTVKLKTSLTNFADFVLLKDPFDNSVNYGKVALNNPGLVGTHYEIVGSFATAPGNTVDVYYLPDIATVRSSVTVNLGGTNYPDGERHTNNIKLYNDPGCIDGDSPDNDGVCNEWEDDGVLTIGDYSYTCTQGGCTDTSKDIFLELDWMEGHRPDDRAVQDVIDVFAQNGIFLHVQVDDQAAIAHDNDIGFPGIEDPQNPQYAGFDQLKGNQFGTLLERNTFGINPSGPNEGALKDEIRDMKHQVFHYGFFNHERQWNAGESGVGETNGNDFMISLGSFSGKVGSKDQQAGTLMHELGHNLGFLHGGNEDVNYKPNYFSVMNHARQMPDFDSARELDYSHADLFHGDTSPYLDEWDIIENQGSPPRGLDDHPDHTDELIIYFCDSGSQGGLYYTPGGPVNWECDSHWDKNPSHANVNGQPGNKEKLTGYNDWANLNYHFVNSDDYEDGVHVNNGNGNAGAPDILPPGVVPDRNYKPLLSGELELTIDDIVNNRIKAELALYEVLLDLPDEAWRDTIEPTSFDEYLGSTPQIIFTQAVSQYQDDLSKKRLTMEADAKEGSTTIEITGKSDITNHAITVTVFAPNGNLVTVEQIAPSLDGIFEKVFTTGGKLWAQNGTYTITAQYGYSSEYTATVEIEIFDGVIGGLPDKVFCGDEIVTPPEECDDGNTTSGDGCSSTCNLEETFTREDLEEAVGKDAPPGLSTKEFFFWGTQNAVEATNHHDLSKTKVILEAIDLGLEFNLINEGSDEITQTTKGYGKVSPIINHLIASQAISLDFQKTDIHHEEHEPTIIPIVNPHEVIEMIEDTGAPIFVGPDVKTCPDGYKLFSGECIPVCLPHEEYINGKCVSTVDFPWWLIVMMIAIIVVVLVVAFIPRRTS
ncbi:MAG: DUF4215 domain-containing protein [Nitrosopumilus sp.]|nr:DUF4215 domain-containing protein [Nitrosopumilus sp.]